MRDLVRSGVPINGKISRGRGRRRPTTNASFTTPSSFRAQVASTIASNHQRCWRFAGPLIVASLLSTPDPRKRTGGRCSRPALRRRRPRAGRCLYLRGTHSTPPSATRCWPASHWCSSTFRGGVEIFRWEIQLTRRPLLETGIRLPRPAGQSPPPVMTFDQAGDLQHRQRTEHAGGGQAGRHRDLIGRARPAAG